MTWGVTFIGQRGQFEIGLKGSLCVGISRDSSDSAWAFERNLL